MKKFFYLIYLLFSIIIIFFNFTGCNSKYVEQDDVNMIGNTSTNLNNGGKVCKQGEYIYYCSPNQKVFNYIYRTSDTLDIEKIKRFVRTPNELSVMKNKLFFKLNTGYSANSSLYCIDLSSGFKKTIINKNVSIYTVFKDSIYYILEDTDIGLYVCDFNGCNEKKLIDKHVSGFVCSGDYIYYVSNNSLYEYNIFSQHEKLLYEFNSDIKIYNLMVNNYQLFFTTESPANEQDSYIYCLDTNSGICKSVYSGFATFIHAIDSNRLLFYNNEHYCILDLIKNEIKPLLQDWDNIMELYSFGTDIYFYTADYESDSICENFYYINIDKDSSTPIQIK